MSVNNASILYCHCAYSAVVSLDKRRDMFQALAGSGRNLHAVADLCRMAALRDPRFGELLQPEELVVVACYPRAVKGLVAAAGLSLAGKKIRFYNLREQSVDAILADLQDGPVPIAGKDVDPPGPDGGWIPWFPVIDYDRCKQCKQCLSFCLFGVFELSPEGRVEVRNPQNCKTNCPACARICPDVAIQFPKFAEAPINGAPIIDEDLERAKVKVNLEKMLGSDVYEALAERRKKAGTRRLVARGITPGLASPPNPIPRDPK